MPDVQTFLRGFNLTAGNRLGSFKIESATGSEEVISRYHKYDYKFTLTVVKIGDDDFEPSNKDSDIAELLTIFREISKKVLSIKAIRNYYFCRIERPNSSDIYSQGHGRYVINLIGHSKR